MVITELRISSGLHCLLSGTSVDIQCVNFGFPRSQIVFFRGKEQIIPGQGSFSNFEAVEGKFDTVRLTMVQVIDGGDYVCEARMGNNELTRSRPVRLVYCSKCWLKHFSSQATQCVCCSPPTALPTIVDLVAPMNHTEGTRFELVCSFTGIPNPQILWEKGGSVFLLGEGRRVINSTGSPMRSQLVINSLTLSDAGVYTCSVTNVAGTDTRSVRLEVERGQ